MRKTIDRKAIIDRANQQLAQDGIEFPRCNAEYRQAIINFVDGLLIDNDSYRGFAYLKPNDLVNPDELPGINPDQEDKWYATDPTRRAYI